MRRASLLATLAVLLAAACQSSSTTSTSDAGNVGESDANSIGNAAPDAQLTSCTTPYDCSHFTSGPEVACCIDEVCIYGEAAQAKRCSDPAGQIIMASSYDQSCQKDSDCVAGLEGNFCQAGAYGNCTNATINKSALAQYQADVAKTMAGVCYGVYGCTSEIPPCCDNGVCTVSGQCFDVVTGDASTDAGSSRAADPGDTSRAGYFVDPRGKACVIFNRGRWPKAVGEDARHDAADDAL